jgi:hypothetical protein
MARAMKLSPEETRKEVVTTLYSLMSKYNLDLDRSAVNKIVESAMENRSKDPNVRNLLLQEIRKANPQLAKRIEFETERHKPSRGHMATPHEPEFHRPAKGHEYVSSETERHKPSRGHEAVPSEYKKAKKKRKQ